MMRPRSRRSRSTKTRSHRALLLGALVALPAPNAPIPAAPAAAWRANERALVVALDAWNKRTPPPRDVVLRALYEQRIVRTLAVRSGAPPAALRDDVAARRALDRLAASTPPTAHAPRVGRPASAAALLGWYREAQRRFGVRWQLLAAVNFVESAFGKVKDASTAGAQGPMQFLPATWRAYGLGGDVHDPHDALLGAANYLAADGARRDERGALLHYNHSPLYVSAVSLYANRIAGDVHAFFAYYSWQVYARTRAGVRRLTGPR